MSLNQHWTKKEVSEPPERSRRAVLLFTELHTRYSKDPLAGHEPNPHTLKLQARLHEEAMRTIDAETRKGCYITYGRESLSLSTYK